MKKPFIVVLLLLLAATANAQQWAKPARTPNTDVKCTTCAGKAKDGWTPGYPATLGVYIGRFLDSNASSDCQQDFRTYRADRLVAMSNLNRLYFQVGSAIFAYDLDRFFQRVGAGEALSLANNRAKCFTNIPDIALPYDSFYYAELQPANIDDSGRRISSSGWDISSGGDGQTRLTGFDADNRGYVYLATTWYRWGIVRDDRRRDGALMQFVWQVQPLSDSVIPVMVASLRGSDGKYYAVVSDTNGPTLNVFDVTDPASPVKRPNVQRSMRSYAKSADGTRVAVTTADEGFQIFTTDALVTGGAPLLSAPGPLIRGVASDGQNFFTATDASTGLVISSYKPSGAGYVKVGDFPTSRVTLATLHLSYGAGHLVQVGFTDGAYELRLFKVSQ